MKLSDYVISFLIENGIHHIFGVIGGAITHLVDSVYNYNNIHFVAMHHEQAAAFAAESYSRTNSNIGVCMATSGPGATNLITGIGNAYFDSIPCIYITGQVNTYDYKYSKDCRQMGFQETDIVSIVKPITKYATMVDDPISIKYQLQKAVYLAKSNRPGPVLLDIPMNIQRAKINPDELPDFFKSKEILTFMTEKEISRSNLGQIINLMKHSKRPLVLAGGGVRSSGAVDELYQLVKKTGIPVVTSLMGLDSFPHDNSFFYGMIGAYGNRYSNLAAANCDLLLIFGSRLDSRQTGTDPTTFAKKSKKIHIDIDKTELGTKVKSHICIESDLKSFITELNGCLVNDHINHYEGWYTLLKYYKKRFPDHVRQINKDELINPNYFMNYLSGIVDDDSVVCLDVGQHQMWAAQSFSVAKNQRILISGGMGSMGFCLPASIGASLGASGRQILAITGDGGFQMNIQELQTIARNRLPIKIFLINNNCLGMVRQFQNLYFENRCLATVEGYSCPDFCKVVSSYGIKSISIKTVNDLQNISKECLLSPYPLFVDVQISMDADVNPKLEYDRPIENQSPYLSEEELKDLLSI